MQSMARCLVDRKIIVGVDTHKHLHVAVAIDELGLRIADRSFAADSVGYGELLGWARDFGFIIAVGVEGTGSYGAGLASHLRRNSHRVVEVNRGDRRSRRANGKSDTLDAEAAARAVLAGTANATPKTGDGVVEMIRQIKIARDTASKGRTAAIITLKTIVVNAPPALRESLQGLADRKLIETCARFKQSSPAGTIGSAKHALRALARRWKNFDQEVKSHDAILERLTREYAPTLREGFGIGADSAAEMLIVFGDNPDRIRSERAFAKLCGVCPILLHLERARHRLSRGGHRQANAALYRAALVRMQHHQPTLDYVARRTAEGLSKRDIIRCVKRFLAREIYRRVMTDFRARTPILDS